ncbi:hypothetical protein E3N88_23216 [Mikania micrantha]|uniref:Aminotransferase-like plant mobile domain-containing protein n=1 Tax=Mikania micrantha TaxID=192012 RepID=A0A5N6NF97_9ASTR|nr:hypothetical protein E3N88_23216 [Mikania micrantha]
MVFISFKNPEKPTTVSGRASDHRKPPPTCVPVVVASSAKASQQIMKTHDSIFLNQAKSRVPSILSYNVRDIAFADYGRCLTTKDNPQYLATANGDFCGHAHFTSGPLNNDLLWLSGSHRGDYYFQNPDRDDGILRIRRGDQDFWMHLNSNPIPENVMEFITLAGFGGIIQCGNRRLDSALISALVERWRPETHTFHILIGETTVTLQYVNILCGLQIEGNVVSGVDLTLNTSQIIALFENLMGEELPIEAVHDFIRDMASQAMRYGQVEHYMDYYPTHMSQDPVGYQVPLVPQSIRQRNRRQAQAQNVEPEVQTEPLINSPHLSSMDHSSGNQLHSPSLNFGEVGLFKSIIDYSLLPQLNTPPAPGFRHLPNMRPPRDRSLSLELDMFDLNTSMDYTNEDNNDNDNLATRRGRRQIRRPGCGTH